MMSDLQSMMAISRTKQIQIYDFLNYKEYILQVIANMPKPRGQFRRFAAAMRVHTSMVSQVLRGNLELTLEQGLLLAEHLSLGKRETEYLLFLILYSRAGSVNLKTLFLTKLQGIQKAQKASRAHLMPPTLEASPEDNPPALNN